MKASRLLPFDWLVIGYSTAMFLLLVLIGRPFPEYRDEMAFYISMVIVTCVIVLSIDPARNRWLSLFRYGYPVVLFTFFYSMTGGTIFLLHDNWFDPQLTAFEKSIFGVNPTLYIDQHLLSVWFNELVMAFYFCYYFMIPGFTIYVFLKHDFVILKRAVTAICLTFFVSYPVFFLYPVEGPRWHFVDQYVNEVQGPVFRQMVNFVIANGAVRGGCVPSTHVAVAVVILLFCLKHYRRVGLALIPVNLGLAIGTFWGRFHYVSDVVAGIAIAVACTLAVWKWYDRFDPINRKRNRTSKVPVSHVA